jgi:DNA polymerase-3 subunit gamma/tau
MIERRWRLGASLALLLVAPTVLLAAGRGGAAVELGNYNGTVSATAVHAQAGSSAFPNYATGAVDNHYPLAAARLDSSPNAQAYSSPLDTGPLGQTVAASGQQNQPQYADTRCPPQCDDKPVTVGGVPGPFASSQTSDHKAIATAQSGGVALGGGAPAPPGGGGAPALPSLPPKSGNSTPNPAPASAASGPSPLATPASGALDAGRVAALRTALVDWRARFLTADDARRYAMPAADTPDGIAGDTARSESRLDGSTLVLDGTSSVGRLVLGGGALVLHDVNVRATVTNDGTPKKTVTVNVGAAEVGGTPVTIGADGVSVNGQAVAGVAGGGAQASAALNQALGQAGVEVRSLAPSLQQTDHQLTLDAVGVLIRLAPASPAPGVPAQFTALAVGEVFADSLAVPGDAGGQLDDGLPGGIGGDTGSLPSPPSDAGATGGPADLSRAAGPGAVAAAGPAFASDAGSFGNGSSGSSGSSGLGASGSALGSGGSSTAAGRPSRLASPAASRRLVGRHKPTSLLLLYLIWQVLVIGTVASLYLWRKAAA